MKPFLKSFLIGVFAVSVCVAQNMVMDVDSNIYHTIKIGNQEWTVENLRTTMKNMTFPIHLEKDSAAWANIDTLSGESCYCYFNNTTNVDSIRKFGVLYNWYALRRLAPMGWHVAANEDWDTLQNYLIANGYNCNRSYNGNKIAKSLAAKEDWNVTEDSGTIGTNLSLNNSSGFSALPGGYRDCYGAFVGSVGQWWSSSETNTSKGSYCYLNPNANNFGRGEDFKRCGFSVRLVKDQPRK